MAQGTTSAARAAERVHESTALHAVARAGFVVVGVLQVVIGVIAVRVAVGSPADAGGEASQTGAFAQLAQEPGGAVLIVASAVALAALALWYLGQAVLGAVGADEEHQLAERAKDLGKAVVYGVLTVAAATVLDGRGSPEEGRVDALTARAMSVPFGRVAVGAVGVVVVAAGVAYAVRGLRRSFRDTLAGSGPFIRLVVALGVLGYTARGAAFAIIGGLLVWAALTADPDEAAGLDGALRTLGHQPEGQSLLLAVGAGFVAYGLYSFGRARVAKM